MDTLAHGLWGGVTFGQKEKSQYKWAFLLGMAPDLLSFGPYFLMHLPTIIQRWTGPHRIEPPNPHIIPEYVYHAYNITHSLVIWTVLVALLWIVRRKAPWVMGAWALHILCDIPTHSIRFFPTPYLWPFSTPFIDGRPWARAPFMWVNYSAILLTYLVVYLYKSRIAIHRTK